MDNNLNTRWSAEGYGEWIQYNLGTQKTVSSVKIAWYRGDKRWTKFDIKVSANGTSWTTVISQRTSSGTSKQLEAYNFNSTSCQYVRITGYGNEENDWNSITEVEIP